jgi:hypothetical protein
MNAAFGDVSAGGTGIPEFDVTQSGGSPSAFVAIQSAGNAGGATLSKFSLKTIGSRQGGEQERVGTGVGVGVSPTVAERSNRPSPMAGDDLITAAVTATTVAVPIANAMARLIESLISLCHCCVKRKTGGVRCVKRYWEITADNLKKAGWSWGWVSAIDSQGRTI